MLGTILQIMMNISNTKFFLILITMSAISISAFGGYIIDNHFSVFGQIFSPIKITKQLNNSYTILSGSSNVGPFSTTYKILGNIVAIKKNQQLIISTIKQDFNNSPIIGYIKSPSVFNTQKSITLSNPFASKITINQNIETLINNAIMSTKDLNTAKILIQCDFGDKISQWNCKSNGLLG